MKNINENVKRYLSKELKDKFGCVEYVDDAIDNCKYILYTSQNYCFEDGGTSYPCKSIKEILYFLKNSVVKK